MAHKKYVAVVKRLTALIDEAINTPHPARIDMAPLRSAFAELEEAAKDYK